MYTCYMCTYMYICVCVKLYKLYKYGGRGHDRVGSLLPRLRSEDYLSMSAFQQLHLSGPP